MIVWEILIFGLIPGTEAEGGGEFVIDYLQRDIDDLFYQSNRVERGGYG
jgi:hypothetical protein